MGERLFGTDGIRGTMGSFPICEEGGYRLGRAVADVMAEGTGRVFCGRDPRPGGDLLSEAVLRGLRDGGCDAVDLGIVPTPAVAHFVAVEQGAAGMAISASHNPATENGFKLFGPGGEKVCEGLERLVEGAFLSRELPAMTNPGRLLRRIDAVERYVAWAISTVPAGCDLRGLTIAVDCARGATRQTTPAALRMLGANVVTVADEDDGARINEDCGSLHPECVRGAAAAAQADLGMAHDGDGDRLLVVDEEGSVVCGDKILGLAAKGLLGRGELTGGHVVGTILSNIGLEHWLTRQGCQFHRSAVGDRNVWMLMRKHDAAVGGEPSGHMMFRRLAPTDDALISALQVLAQMVRSGERLCDLARDIPLVPQQSLNLRVRTKPAIDSLQPLRSAMHQADRLLGDRGRVIVRYSGTEPMARILAEGPDQAVLGQVVGLLHSAFRSAGVAA